MRSVYELTLRQLSGRWRLAIMALLTSLPVIITMLMLADEQAASLAEFEVGILGAMLAGSITPLVVLAIAGAAFGNELEDRTLANLTLSPLPRWKIALPKLLATISIAVPFTLVSALVTSHFAFLADPLATTSVLVAAFVVVALYASAFVWLGLVSTQAIGIGLLYIVLWEGFFSGFVSGVRFLSIRFYAIAIMHGIDPRRFAQHDHVPLGAAIALSLLIFGGFLWLTIRRLRRMDVP